MNRRNLLKALGTMGLAPALPSFPALPAGAVGAAQSSGSAAAATASLISDQTYQWAEMLVRAHDKCNLSMLERLLQLDTAAATQLRNRLMENGVISGAKSACGMHRAVKPLYQELRPRPSLSDALQERLAHKEKSEPESERGITTENEQNADEANPDEVKVDEGKNRQVESLDEEVHSNQIDELQALDEKAESELERAESDLEADGRSDSNQINNGHSTQTTIAKKTA